MGVERLERLIDPSFDDSFRSVNKDESLVIHVVVLLHGPILTPSLARLLGYILMQILEVSDLSLHFMVAMLQSHFHHMNHFVDWDGRRVLVLEHARSLEFSLVDKGDLSHRDHNSRFLRLALES